MQGVGGWGRIAQVAIFPLEAKRQRQPGTAIYNYIHVWQGMGQQSRAAGQRWQVIPPADPMRARLSAVCPNRLRLPQTDYAPAGTRPAHPPGEDFNLRTKNPHNKNPPQLNLAEQTATACNRRSTFCFGNLEWQNGASVLGLGRTVALPPPMQSHSSTALNALGT